MYAQSGNTGDICCFSIIFLEYRSPLVAGRAGRCPWERQSEISCHNFLTISSFILSLVLRHLSSFFLFSWRTTCFLSVCPSFPQEFLSAPSPLAPAVTPLPLESLLPEVFGLRGPFLKPGQFPCGRCWATAAASVVWNSNPWWVFRACRWIN